MWLLYWTMAYYILYVVLALIHFGGTTLYIDWNCQLKI